MWIPALADAAWMASILDAHADVLGLGGGVAQLRVLDTRVTHPHRPSSARCSGWGTYTVTPRAGEGAPVLLYVKAFPKGASLDAWQRHAVEGTTARHLPEHDVIAWRFPHDPRLPVLPELVDPASAAEHLRRLERPAAEHIDGVVIDVVRYQPEVTATLRYGFGGDGLPPGQSVFAKAFAGPECADVADRHRRLSRRAREVAALRVPEPVDADLQHSVLWTRGVQGVPLLSALDAATQDAASLGALAGDVAQLVAALHGSGVPLSRSLTVDDLVSEARKKVDKLAVGHPPVAGSLGVLLHVMRQLRSRIEDPPTCTLHGDLHIDQMLATADGPVLVDLDSMVLGAAEIDLAEFAVDLGLRDVPEPVFSRFVVPLLDAYEAHAARPLDPALLRVCVDAEFINRCYRHLRRRSPGWETALEAELGAHDRVTSVLPA